MEADWVCSIAQYMGYINNMGYINTVAAHQMLSKGHAQQEVDYESLHKPIAKDTVGDLLDDWLANTYPVNSTQRYRIKDFFDRLIIPEIGCTLLHNFTESKLRGVLDGIAVIQNKPATSRLCRRWLRAAVRYGKAHRRISREAFYDLMDVPPVRHKTKHKNPLRPEEIRQLWWDLEKLSRRQTVLGIRLLLLTFVRPIELMNAFWKEFDLVGTLNPLGPVWIVPSERVKMRTPHFVPLSSAAIQLLQELRTLTGDTTFVFPGARKNRPITRQAWVDELRMLDWHSRFSPHACRATASTLLRELELGQSDHIEIQLGHLTRNETRASYDFSTCLRQRYSMMQGWSNYIVGLVGDRSLSQTIVTHEMKPARD